MQPDGRTKVLYLITKGVWGGAQKYVYNLATSLPKDKYDVTVVCGKGEILKEKLEKEGIKVYEVKSLKRNISVFSEIFSFLKIFWLILKLKPKVLHLNSPKAGGIGSFAGRLLFTHQIIYTAHGFAWNENRSFWQKILITFFTWVTILLSHKTIVINTREKKQAQELPLIKDSKIVLIRNGIENIDFLEKNEAREKILSIIPKPLSHNLESVFWIGTISELHRNKGLSYALSGLSKISRPFVFVIIGEGEERKNIEKLITWYNLKDKVFLIGFMDDAKKYLKAFDIFLLSSVKEGLPYTILESGLAGIPVVSTSVGGIPDIIDNGKNGILVTREKSGEITRAIEYLMDNKKEATDFSAKLKEKVLKDFSMQQMLDETLKIYQ